MPRRSEIQRATRKRDKLRRNWCRRCPFCAPSGQCLDTRIRSGRCGDWVYYPLPGGKQCRRRWVRPKDPRTPAQRQSRVRLGAASHKYSAALTDQERDACIAAAVKRRSRPRLGQSGPLTGQQYSVHSEYATRTAGKVESTIIPAKVPQPQKVTRPTWETHRGNTGVPPRQRERGLQAGGKRKPATGPEAPQSQRLTRSTRQGYQRGVLVAPRRSRRGLSSSRALFRGRRRGTGSARRKVRLNGRRVQPSASASTSAM